MHSPSCRWSSKAFPLPVAWTVLVPVVLHIWALGMCLCGEWSCSLPRQLYFLDVEMCINLQKITTWNRPELGRMLWAVWFRDHSHKWLFGAVVKLNQMEYTDHATTHFTLCSGNWRSFPTTHQDPSQGLYELDHLHQPSSLSRWSWA